MKCSLLFFPPTSSCVAQRVRLYREYYNRYPLFIDTYLPYTCFKFPHCCPRVPQRHIMFPCTYMCISIHCSVNSQKSSQTTSHDTTADQDAHFYLCGILCNYMLARCNCELRRLGRQIKQATHRCCSETLFLYSHHFLLQLC